ncbi:MAG: hypothetical protein GY865_13050 [candidate division Zixibacteria bacterium]|nr:hypothetical protein [candidate division Zixibacteria bacterium]
MIEENKYSPSENHLTQKLIWAFVAIVGIYGLYQTISLAWVCDDAFISFRYAKNLINGNGLVFNVGEVVEGYTNFLWTILIAGAMFIGLEPILFTQAVSFISYVIVFLLLIYISIKISNQSKSKTIVLPVAALAIIVQYDSQVWATSGLETYWVTALVTSAFAILIFAESKKTFLMAGVVLTLAVLTRPDAMIFYMMAIPYIFLQNKKPIPNLIYYLIPLVIIYIPYWIIRYSYYGYPFPNTYYAKSADLSWYSQGFIYFWTYIKTYYSLILLLPAVAFIAIRLLDRLKTKKSISGTKFRLWLLSILFIVPYIFYVIRIGGDFMFARFFIPITPICFILLESVLSSLNIKPVMKFGIGIIIVLSVLFRWAQFSPENHIISGIIDERTYYPAEKIEQAKIDGARVKKYLDGLDAIIGFYGAKAMLVYYAEAPMAIECHAGLTDEFVAHQPLKYRGRIGHEKGAPESYMLKRKINFIAIETAPVTPDVVGIISFDGTTMPIKYYENRLMNKLKNIPGVEFVDFQLYLDDYISNMEKYSTDRIKEDFDQFQYYYFDINNDTLRYNIIANAVNNRMNPKSENSN